MFVMMCVEDKLRDKGHKLQTRRLPHILSSMPLIWNGLNMASYSSRDPLRKSVSDEEELRKLTHSLGIKKTQMPNAKPTLTFDVESDSHSLFIETRDQYVTDTKTWWQVWLNDMIDAARTSAFGLAAVIAPRNEHVDVGKHYSRLNDLKMYLSQEL